jgi:hypothetical protein
VDCRAVAAFSFAPAGVDPDRVRASSSYSTATSRICPRRVIVLLIDSADSDPSSTLPWR